MCCDLWISKFRKEQFPRKLYEEIRYLSSHLYCICKQYFSHFQALEDAKKDDAENSVEVDENKIKLAKEVEAAAKAEKARLKKAKKKDKKATTAEQKGATAYNNTFL